MPANSTVWIESVRRDVNHAARLLRRSPRFTATALILLVLGIGSTTAILSVVHAVLLRPLPYPDAGRLVFVAGYEGAGVVWPNFDEWRSRARSFDGLAGSLADAVIVTSGPIPRRFESRSVTANFFRVLGVAPVQGRIFDDADARPDADRTVVVSHAFWIRELGGAPAAIGRTLPINRRPFTVIGVLPPRFRYLAPADVYILLEPQVAANYRGMLSRNTRTTLYALGRLKPGVSLTAARAEMEAIAAALALEHGATAKGTDVQLVALADRVVGDMAPTLTAVAGGVVLLLLIACANLAGLLLNRSVSRGLEFSIRAAIGASRRALLRQALVEHALLVVIGGVLGAMAGAAILTALVKAAPREIPRLDEIRLDLVVLSWTTLFSCACALLFGIVPAIRASGVSGQALVVRSVRGSTRSAVALRRGLMLAEIAVATVLLSGAGLMVQTIVRLARVDPGFDPHNLQTVMFSLTGPEWPDARKQVFYSAMVERLRAVPGVENAALTYTLPMLGSNWWSVFNFPGRTADDWISVGEFPNAAIVPVTAGYFETLKIPLLKGRQFDRTDTPDSMPVAIVNSRVARRYWPGDDAIGKQFMLGFPSQPFGPWRTIVGVVGDIRQHGVDQEMPPQVFIPAVQTPRTTMFAIARTRTVVPATSLEAAIHDLDRTIPVFNDRTVERVMRESSSRRRIAMVVLSVFAGVAVLLAAIGVYGVIAQGVSERRHEIGVRMALGATRGRILRFVTLDGLAVASLGIACGVGGAVAAARSLASLVFGVTVTDPATLGTVAVLLAIVTLLACYTAARSATRVDPVQALRSE